MPTLIRAEPRNVGMAGDLGARLDSIVAVAISQGAAPGVALAVGRYGRLVHIRAYGRIDTGTVSNRYRLDPLRHGVAHQSRRDYDGGDDSRG